MSNWRQSCRSQSSATCWLYLHWKGSKVDVLQQNEGNRWRPVQSTFLRKLHPVSPSHQHSAPKLHALPLQVVSVSLNLRAGKRCTLRGYTASRFYYLVPAEPTSLLSDSNTSAAWCLALFLQCEMKSWPMWAGCLTKLYIFHCVIFYFFAMIPQMWLWISEAVNFKISMIKNHPKRLFLHHVLHKKDNIFPQASYSPII